MNKVYIEQIKRLEETVKELMDYNESKRIQKFTVYKTVSEGKHTEENIDRTKIMATLTDSRQKIERVIPYTTSEQTFISKTVPFATENREYTYVQRS